MPSPRAQAIEREARRLWADLQQGRQATISTTDQLFRDHVITRLRQLMVGEDVAGARYEDPDD